MKEKRALVWFTNNLRVRDNEVLEKGCFKAAAVVPLFCLDANDFSPTQFGFPKTGSRRATFLLESLENLRANLQAIGGDLLVELGKPEEIIPELAKKYSITDVYTTREVTDEELTRQQLVEGRLQRMGIPLHFIWQNTLYHLEDIPWPIHHLPDTYTHFRKEIEANACVRMPFPAPDQIKLSPDLPLGPIPSLQNLGLSPVPSDPRAVMEFKGGEDEGRKRLSAYFWDDDCLKDYKLTRDELLGKNYSSKLSPWLANGCLSPGDIYRELKEYEKTRTSNESTTWFYYELLWRDFFRFTAKKQGKRMFLKKGFRAKQLVMFDDHEKFLEWREARTPEPFVNANMEELQRTGFMSNRGRQNVASYLVKDLQVNWTWGAEWFQSQLIDYDVASNWLNWAYIAGVGNDSRAGRYFNPKVQAKKYDPHGLYVSTWHKDRV